MIYSMWFCKKIFKAPRWILALTKFWESGWSLGRCDFLSTIECPWAKNWTPNCSLLHGPLDKIICLIVNQNCKWCDAVYMKLSLQSWVCPVVLASITLMAVFFFFWIYSIFFIVHLFLIGTWASCDFFYSCLKSHFFFFWYQSAVKNELLVKFVLLTSITPLCGVIKLWLGQIQTYLFNSNIDI